MNNKSIRILANINSGEDARISLNVEQDFDNIELLSLNINKGNALYKTHTSKYGCVAGRVLANGGFGVPNAKLSIFVEKDTNLEEDDVISQLYPYTSINSSDSNNIRYNLLPEENEGNDNCYQAVGTFPLKRMVLDDNNVLEVYERYYKYSSVTNKSGDYMIFGVPTGSQKLLCDVDLSDCGILSQKPRDFTSQGYNSNQFESPNKFGKSTNLDNLAQISSTYRDLDVLPFWGEDSENAIAITRCDINLTHKFETTCVFMGSVFSDNSDNGFSTQCVPTPETGVMKNLEASRGTIEIIRKTFDDTVEDYQVDATHVIDENGTWCFRIPMNLDYITTDEYGNIVPTDDPNKGIATRTRVRFRISLTGASDGVKDNHYVKVLIPNNPEKEEDLDYVFGTNTLDDEFGTKSFRDLYWNKVYSVKSYIPRVQQGYEDEEERYTGIKHINAEENNNNPIPYNHLRVKEDTLIPLKCQQTKRDIKWAYFLNRWFGTRISVSSEACPEMKGWHFYPGLTKEGDLRNALEAEQEMAKKVIDEESNEYINGGSSSDSICVTGNINNLIKCVELNTLRSGGVLSFEFYNDWLNGSIYMPRWFASFKKKTSYFNGESKSEVETIGCFEDSFVGNRKYVQECALSYAYESADSTSSEDSRSNMYSRMASDISCKNEKGGGILWLFRKPRKYTCNVKYGKKYFTIFNNKGGIHRHKTYKGQSVYYFRPYEWTNNKRCPLFATDIILLGSIDSNDIDGIPELAKTLPSTTYKMPGMLAQTNMPTQHSLYGFTENDSMCTNSVVLSGVKQYNDTFESYQGWSSKQDFATTENTEEYAVTLESGIDWTYLGPKPVGLIESLEKAYNPGGHFIGYTCDTTITTTKTCTNLARICEMGVVPSRRKGIIIPIKKNGKITYTWGYSIPNGIIAKDEIVDESGRNSFAIMNFENLKSSKDENMRLRPKLTFLNLTNFNGELKNIVSDNTFFNKKIGLDDYTKKDSNKYIAYDITNEYTSKDYYKFRLGLTDENYTHVDLDDKYLLKEAQHVSLPVYANSFYFYFGLRKGYTAIERFLAEYYPECPDENSYEGRVEITEIGAVTKCDIKGKSSAKIDIYDIDGPYLMYVYKDGMPCKALYSNGVITVDTDKQLEESVTFNKSSIIVNGLTIGTYSFVIGGISTSSTVTELKIKVQDPIDMTEFAKIIEWENFSDTDNFSSYNQEALNNPVLRWSYDTENNKWVTGETGTYSRKELKGYISLPKLNEIDESIGVVGYLITNGIYYKTSNDREFVSDETIGMMRIDWNSIDAEETMTTPLAWDGNVTYKVYALYRCDETSSKHITIFLKNVYVTMCGRVDIYYGSENISFRRLEEKRESKSYRWFNDLCCPENSSLILTNDKLRWIFKKSILYNKSFYSGETTRINYGLINSTGSDYDICGPAEYFEDVEKTEAEVTTVKRLLYIKNRVKGEILNKYELDFSSLHYPYLKNLISDKEEDMLLTYGPAENYGFGSEYKVYLSNNSDFSQYSNEYLQHAYRPFYAKTYIIYKSLEDGEYKMDINLYILNGVSKKIGNSAYLGNLKYRIGNSSDGYIINYSKNFNEMEYGEKKHPYVHSKNLGKNMYDIDYAFPIVRQGLHNYKYNNEEWANTGFSLEEMFGYTSCAFSDLSGKNSNANNVSYEVTDGLYEDEGGIQQDTITRTKNNITFLEIENAERGGSKTLYFYVVNDSIPFEERTYKYNNKSVTYQIKTSHLYETTDAPQSSDKGNNTEFYIYMPNGEYWPRYYQGPFTVYYNDDLKPKLMFKYLDLDNMNTNELVNICKNHAIVGINDDFTDFGYSELKKMLGDEDLDEYEYYNKFNKRFSMFPKHTSEINAIRSYKCNGTKGEYENEFTEIVKSYKDKEYYSVEFVGFYDGTEWREPWDEIYSKAYDESINLKIKYRLRKPNDEYVERTKEQSGYNFSGNRPTNLKLKYKMHLEFWVKPYEITKQGDEKLTLPSIVINDKTTLSAWLVDNNGKNYSEIILPTDWN